MAAPLGNRNAAKAKLWAAAIERALEKRGGGDKIQALNDLAEKFLTHCESGDLAAFKELGDRLDGKPSQTIAGDPEQPLIHRIERTIVNAQDSDS